MPELESELSMFPSLGVFMVAEPVLDVTVTATLYSQVAGLLAGFAFTGLLGYLTRSEGALNSGDEQREGSIVLSLFATFTALIICAIVYSILSGGAPNSGPALIGLNVYGPIFGTAILAMFHDVLLLAKGNDNLALTVRIARYLVTVVGPTAVMVLVSAGNLYTAACATSCRVDMNFLQSRSSVLGFVLSSIVFVGSIIAVIITSRFPVKRDWVRRDWWAAMPACLVLLVSSLGLVVPVLLSFLPTDFKPTDGLVMMIITCAFVFIALFSIASAVASA